MSQPYLGLVPATIASDTDHLVGCEVPAIGAGRIRVSLSVRGRHSNAVGFVVEAP